MLTTQDAGHFARLVALLAQRQSAYARIKHHLDVTGLSPQAVTKQICELADSRSLL